MGFFMLMETLVGVLFFLFSLSLAFNVVQFRRKKQPQEPVLATDANILLAQLLENRTVVVLDVLDARGLHYVSPKDIGR